MGGSLEAAYGGVADTLADAVSLPAAAYLDEAVFAAEVERVFKAGWVPVARESEVAEPGDFQTCDLFGTPLVVTRDPAGDVHVLSSVCRHRGMPVAEGRGNAKALTCPYHLWRYGLDGRLMSAPAMDGQTAFDRTRCALPRVAHETWGGWIFANLDGTAAPLAPGLEPLAKRLEALAPGRFVTAGVVEFPSPWNWKVMVENFLESYHHIGPHAGTLQQTHPGLGTHPGESGGLFTILENPPVEGGDPFVVAAIFPLTLMFFTEGPAPVGVWYELSDVRRDAFTLRVHLLAPPEMARIPEFVEGFTAQVTHIHNEDIPACEGVQRGVASPLYEPGPLSRLEGCLWAFHRHLKARLVEA